LSHPAHGDVTVVVETLNTLALSVFKGTLVLITLDGLVVVVVVVGVGVVVVVVVVVVLVVVVVFVVVVGALR